jgi:hypothetical protein
VLWALANRGEVNVLALIACSANDYSAPAMHAIATYYGHSGVPVGAYKGTIPNINGSSTSPYAQQIANQFGKPGETRFNYPDAVTVYRQALASAADNSVYIVANGYYQPLQALLQSQPDSISPLTGVRLIAQKVKRLVSSGGWLPSGSDGNFSSDPDGASYVFQNWPGEIVSVGSNVGFDVISGPATTSDPAKDPVKDAYDLYARAQGLSSSTTPAWGQVALLFAVRGIGTDFSIGGYNGQTVVENSSQPQPGFDNWSQSPSVGHSWMQKSISAADMAAIVNPLLQGSSNMPILRSISPATVPAGSPAQSLSLTGTNFFNDSQVLFNGNSRPTTFVSGTQLAVQLSANDLEQAGNQAISISNAAEGNWTSNTSTLNVFAATPTLTGISPANALVGSGPIAITLTGSSFTGNSAVQVNGAARSTTFVSNTQLTSTLTAADVSAAGSLAITVATAGGGTSSALTFIVNNPVASLSTMSPSSVVAGSPGFTLTLSGGNFVRNSVVQVNGSNRTTTFVSSNQLTAAIPASDIAVGAYLSITIFNPAPGGGTSPVLTLTVNNPVPSIASISPNPVIATGGTFTLTVSGSGFVKGSVVQVDGTSRPTTFVSPTQVQAQLSGGAIGIGQHAVTVFNSAPGGGTSNAATLTVVSLLGKLIVPDAGMMAAALDVRAEPMVTAVG